MTINLNDFAPFLVAFGAILGVWVRAEVSIATLKERDNNRKESIAELKNAHANYHEETKETVDKIYRTLDEITKQIYSNKTKS